MRTKEIYEMTQVEDLFSEAWFILEALEKTAKEDKKVPVYVYARLELVKDYFRKGIYKYYNHLGHLVSWETLQNVIEDEKERGDIENE